MFRRRDHLWIFLPQKYQVEQEAISNPKPKEPRVGNEGEEEQFENPFANP